MNAWSSPLLVLHTTPDGTSLTLPQPCLPMPPARASAAAPAAPRARQAAIQLTAQAMDRGEIALSVGSDAASACHVLSTNAAPPGVPSQAVIKVPHELRPTKVKGMFMSIPEVKAVVPNRVVRIAQAITPGEAHRPTHSTALPLPRPTTHRQLRAALTQLCATCVMVC